MTVDQRWVPDNEGEKSLYLRPFMFATEAFLGVRPAQHVTFMVIASPAGAYFKGGVKPVTLWLTEDYTRAGRGGMGAAKTGGNYASSLLPQREAIEQGCDQVVFLDGQEPTYVEELGGMNMYFVHADGRIVTPETGTILEGITRASIIELAGKMGHQVEERRFSIDEWRDGVASGEHRRDLRVRHRGRGHPGRRAPVGRRRDRPPPARPTWSPPDPAGAGRHPVRPRRRHLRLDAPDRLRPDPGGRRWRVGPSWALSRYVAQPQPSDPPLAGSGRWGMLEAHRLASGGKRDRWVMRSRSNGRCRRR